MNIIFNTILSYKYENNYSLTNLKRIISSNIHGRIPHHRIFVLNIIVNLFEIKTYLEIGVHNGASMSYVVHQNNRSIDCYGVDLFCNDKNYKDYDEDKLEIEKTRKNIQRNNESNSKITLLAGNSRSSDIFNRLNNNKFDLLFIDGDHSYKGVKSDFFTYSKLVQSGGFIILDDFVPECPGITRLVNEIKSDPNFFILGNFEGCDLIILKK